MQLSVSIVAFIFLGTASLLLLYPAETFHPVARLSDQDFSESGLNGY